jgi:putative transposase
LTLSEFEIWLTTYITGVYHQRLHSSLGVSPLKQYEKGIFGNDERPGTGLPSRIVDENRLRINFMPFVERTIQEYGVVINDVHYYSDVLRPFIHSIDAKDPRRKRKFIFKQDPRDISVVYFYNPDLKEYSAIPYRNTSHPAISIWELKEITNRLREEGRREINEELIFESYERMREQEEKSVMLTKQSRLKQQKRILHRETGYSLTTNQSEIKVFNDEIEDDHIHITPFNEMEELN